jgi:hypothetical protein
MKARFLSVWGHSELAPTSTSSTGCPLQLMSEWTQPE